MAGFNESINLNDERSLLLEEVKEPSLLFESFKEKDPSKSKKKYNYVESKVKIYRRNIQEQNIKSKPQNVQNDEVFKNNLENNCDHEELEKQIVEQGFLIEEYRKKYYEILEAMAAKDLKIEYFRLELAKLRSNFRPHNNSNGNILLRNTSSFVSLSRSNSENELTTSSFFSDTEIEVSMKKCLTRSQSMSSLGEIATPRSSSKFKKIHKAGKKAISKLFKCSENNESKTKVKFDQIKMKHLNPNDIRKSVHTPNTNINRSISVNRIKHGIPNICVSTTPGNKLKKKKMDSNLKRSVLFKSNEDLNEDKENNVNTIKTLDQALSTLKDIEVFLHNIKNNSCVL